MSKISESIKRYDFEDKIQGKAIYTPDFHPEGMIFAKTFRSKVSRAKILSLQLPPLPKGYFIVDHHDIPAKNIVPVVFEDQPVFAVDEVNYIGEPILLVVGPEKRVILEIMNNISIEYQIIQPILSIEEAETCSAPFIFNNKPYFVDYEYHKGNFDDSVRRAKRVISDEFKTGYQEQAYLETQSMVATYDGHTVCVQGSMQCPYYIVEALKVALGWNESRIRVIQMPTGGAFGGKEEFPSIPGVHAALAAIKSKRPVKLVYDRQEDIQCSSKRHPSIISIKSYLDENDEIIARDIDVKLDGGAYAGLSSVVLQRSIFAAAGCYNIENLFVRGTAYATNNVVSGAFRGFGGPQAFYAIEMHMENIAKQLKKDPIELRRKYFVKQGDTSSTQGTFHDPIVLDLIANEVIAMSDFKSKRLRFESEKLKGIGCSIFYHGCGFTGAGEAELIKPSVRIKKEKSEIEIFISSTEIGQGVLTTMRKIVSSTLEIPIDHVHHNYPDSRDCPDSGPTVASRTVLIVGRLLQDCAIEMKKRWNEESFEIIQSYVYPSHLRWDNQIFKGNAYPDYSWGANVVEVEINADTYEIDVKGIWAVYDIGIPIDDKIVKGQIEGGIVQGLGYAMMEVLESKKGKLSQDTFTTYIIPSSLDIPPIYSKLVKNPSTIGPFGARGLGEIPLVGVAPALACAVQQAIGTNITKIPITPEDIMKGVQL
ncbi:MAG: aldehyde oxidase [Firmicutes bacterium HGW-Firmicutes-19]|nr:MAG: aldehyde oxidase [Firmicutes bacterium HGW-Firmicutes-19]